jgi:phospholipid/cholesterol/gamma-HCH transport system permease protein
MAAQASVVSTRIAASVDRLGGPLREAGDMATFGLRAVVAVGASGRYFAEILRQCATLLLGSTLILVAMVFILGGECGLFLAYLARPLGATAFTGTLMNPCGIREMYPYMFAYIFAAKVGCGLAAELGSMRISDEIAALQSVGIAPMRYVVATRLLAVWMCVPLVYSLGLVTGMLGGYAVTVVQLGDLSTGQFFDGYFGSQGFFDNIVSFVKVFTMATTIAVVGMYYGYRASGGPVGVGDGVAKSMMINLVLIHVIGAALSSAFYPPGSLSYPYGG